MGLDLNSPPTSGQSKAAQEDIELLMRLRQHCSAQAATSPIDERNVTTTSRGSVSSYSSGSNTSYSSGSTRSSISSAPSRKHSVIHRTTSSYTSSITPISERAESPEMFKVNVTPVLPHPLSRSVSEYSLRDKAATFRSFPSHESFVSTPTFFCTFCSNGFESRADWETHEWLYHERQSYWPCPHPGCEVVFDSGPHFEMHHEARHSCLNCKHAAEVVRLLPERKAWACGFDLCKAVFTDWNKRCKHVASHYEGMARRHGTQRETPDWTYSNTIRNLLRQNEVRDQFKKFMIKCHGSKSNWPKLNWQRDDTAELLRCLEYRDFRRGIPEIVQMAYRLGHPAYNAAVQVMSRPPTPPSEEVSRNHSRVQSSDSSLGGASLRSPTSPQARPPRSYLYERKSSLTPSLTTLPEWAPLQHRPVKDYNLPRSLPSSPPDASPPRTRNTSPTRAASLSSEPRRTPMKRMVAREADVKGTGCAALIQFLRQGPPDDMMAPSSHEHRARRVPSPRPPMDLDIQEEGDLEVPPVTPISAAHPSPPAPPGSPQSSLAVPPTPSSLGPSSPQPSVTSLSLFPTPSAMPTPEIVYPVSSTSSDIISQTANPMPPSTLPPSSWSPLPDLTGMNWPLPPPPLQPPPRSSSLSPRPGTSAGEHGRRKKPRSLRWVSISHSVEPAMPSPGDVDFGFCLTQPLDLLQPMPMHSGAS